MGVVAAPMTRADLEVAVSKLATKDDLALLQKDFDFLKEKMGEMQEEMREAHKNFVTKEELEASQAKLGERLQREMRMQTLYMLGGIGALLALFDPFG